MKFFLDTEFIEDGVTIDLVSIGLVCEDGREYYAISKEFNADEANDWVKENVLNKLPKVAAFTKPLGPNVRGFGIEYSYPTEYKTKEEIKKEILEFIGDNKPEFWAYYADYDWVVLCQLFGKMIDLPKHFPMYCNDLKQLKMHKGNPDFRLTFNHTAIEDARENKQLYNFLTIYPWVDLEKTKDII